MAYENGYNAFNYCHIQFKRYREDKMLFTKALQTLLFFQTRSDYPYCVKDMDFALEQILGLGITQLACYERKIILEYDKRVYWNAKDVLVSEPFLDEIPGTNIVEDLPEEKANILIENFKKEYQSFLMTIGSLLDEVYYGEDNTVKLAKIITKPVYGKTNVLRLIRNDNQYLDFNVDEEDIDKLCTTLLSFKRN
ncbi:MAG: hypothetical protein HFG92_13485 [Dorea sp.]|nr:hypothetical protein [Dorea sp.]